MSHINGSENGFQAGWKLSDIGTASSLITRFPLKENWLDSNRMGASAWAFPLVGIVLGFIAGVLLFAMISVGFSAGVSAATSLFALFLMTGGLHEDGIADCADGLGGGKNKEKALEIMKDSRLGTYGVVVLILFFMARWSAMSDLALTAPILSMIFVGAVSRLPMVLAMTAMEHAREDGFSKHVGRPTTPQALTALMFTAIVALIVLGWWALVFVPIVLASTLPLIYLATRKIGGQTGDVLGGTQQCAEVASLALLTMIWI